MTEHECKWNIRAVAQNEPYARCEICKEVMESLEIERRLNTMEQLRAIDPVEFHEMAITVQDEWGVSGLADATHKNSNEGFYEKFAFEVAQRFYAIALEE